MVVRERKKKFLISIIWMLTFHWGQSQRCMAIFVLMWFVRVSRLTQCNSHGCHISILMHAHTDKHTHTPPVLRVVGAPRGVLLSCQSRMDEEAALHSKGLWGNTTKMTHTHTHRETVSTRYVCAPIWKCRNLNTRAWMWTRINLRPIQMQCKRITRALSGNPTHKNTLLLKGCSLSLCEKQKQP